MYKEGQRILERQRFSFPPSWLYVDNIEGEWGAFNDILKRKDSSIQTQVQYEIQLMNFFCDLSMKTLTIFYYIVTLGCLWHPNAF